MQHTCLTHAFGLGLGFATALTCVSADANAADDENTLKVGYAHIGFNATSGDLIGPPGSTPPGVQADLNNASTLALVHERHLSGPWSVVLQVDTPPVVRMVGAGNGAALRWEKSAPPGLGFPPCWPITPSTGRGARSPT